MLTEVTNLQEREVITDKGISLGIIEDVIIDLEAGEIYELLISDTNEELVEEGVSVGVPYRWVQSLDRVVILKHFPGRIRRKDQIEIPQVATDGRKRKLRVVKRASGDQGIARMGWR
jgi:sporulation protein YlmC with PRC-barrel domain